MSLRTNRLLTLTQVCFYIASHRVFCFFLSLFKYTRNKMRIGDLIELSTQGTLSTFTGCSTSSGAWALPQWPLVTELCSTAQREAGPYMGMTGTTYSGSRCLERLIICRCWQLAVRPELSSKCQTTETYPFSL